MRGAQAANASADFARARLFTLSAACFGDVEAYISAANMSLKLGRAARRGSSTRRSSTAAPPTSAPTPRRSFKRKLDEAAAAAREGRRPTLRRRCGAARGRSSAARREAEAARAPRPARRMCARRPVARGPRRAKRAARAALRRRRRGATHEEIGPKREAEEEVFIADVARAAPAKPCRGGGGGGRGRFGGGACRTGRRPWRRRAQRGAFESAGRASALGHRRCLRKSATAAAPTRRRCRRFRGSRCVPVPEIDDATVAAALAALARVRARGVELALARRVLTGDSAEGDDDVRARAGAKARRGARRILA